MGHIQSKGTCCIQDNKQSLLELTFPQSFENSFYMNSSYESPIPDEVYQFQESFHSENFVDESSTDTDKQNEVSEGYLKKLPNSSKINFGTGKSKI